MAISELRKRWSRSKITKTITALKRRRIVRSNFDVLKSDGAEYIDLRGFDPPEVILRLKEHGIDFSYSKFAPASGLGFARLSHCRFLHCVYEGNIGDEFTQCDFSFSKFRRVTAMPDTFFTGCSFSGVQFLHTKMLDVIFTKCSFTSAQFRGAEFIECTFDACTFDGAVFRQVSFGGSTFSRLNHSFRWVDDRSDEVVHHFVPNARCEIDLGDTHMGAVVFK